MHCGMLKPPCSNFRSSLIWVYTNCHSICIFWTHDSMVTLLELKDNYSKCFVCPKYLSDFCHNFPAYEEEMCLIPCPVDCIMSDWSPWSDCSTSCETGTQMRYRHIKQIPSDGGRLCPALDQANKVGVIHFPKNVVDTFSENYHWINIF